MKPADIFDVCLARMRECQATEARIGAVRAGSSAASDGPPRVGNALAEYVADFELCGVRVLRRQPRRLEAFRVLFVADMPYDRAVELLKVKEGTLRYWAHEIRRAVGRELVRAGMWPLRRYREQVSLFYCDDCHTFFNANDPDRCPDCRSGALRGPLTPAEVCRIAEEVEK